MSGELSPRHYLACAGIPTIAIGGILGIGNFVNGFQDAQDARTTAEDIARIEEFNPQYSGLGDMRVSQALSAHDSAKEFNQLYLDGALLLGGLAAQVPNILAWRRARQARRNPD